MKDDFKIDLDSLPDFLETFSQNEILKIFHQDPGFGDADLKRKLDLYNQKKQENLDWWASSSLANNTQ